MVSRARSLPCVFLSMDTATTEIYTLSLHDALPISISMPLSPKAPSPAISSTRSAGRRSLAAMAKDGPTPSRSEEHTSELQSLTNLVCRLLLEKKKQYGSHFSATDPSKRPISASVYV